MLQGTRQQITGISLLIQCYLEAEKAVQLDDKNIKGYFLMAECLVSIAENSKDSTKIEEAI